MQGAIEQFADKTLQEKHSCLKNVVCKWFNFFQRTHHSSVEHLPKVFGQEHTGAPMILTQDMLNRCRMPAAVFSALWFHVSGCRCYAHVPSQAQWLEPKTHQRISETNPCADKNMQLSKLRGCQTYLPNCAVAVQKNLHLQVSILWYLSVYGWFTDGIRLVYGWYTVV